MAKNIQLPGSDPVFDGNSCGSIVGRNVVHFLKPWPHDLESLCDKTMDYYRHPNASHDLTFTVCGDCLKLLKEANNG